MTSLPSHLAESLSRRNDVLEAIEAWRTLRNTQWNNREHRPALENIVRILQFLGLQCDAQGVTDVSTRSTARNSPARRHIIVQVAQEEIITLRGIPQFGSNSNGIYHIVCAWNHRPHTVTTLTPVRNGAVGGQDAVIVLYMNGLTTAERGEIRKNSIADNLSFALLDELLFEYLATIDRDNRWVSFLKCALAYSAPNPYIPEESWGAPVPAEIFYGRENVASDIEDMSGGTHFLFGGRQVGKTALLRNIERRVHDPEVHRFAWFVDLIYHGYILDGIAKDPMDIWDILLNQFVEQGLTGKDALSLSSESVREHLGKLFQKDPRLRVLVMFDEADRFLELDAAKGSPLVGSMRTLMVDANNRFKIVFAGLHSVQRLARSKNTPYRNLRFDPNNPRRGGLGPLKYSEAQRFILEPMHAMGFAFEDPLLVDTILTHTECHPSEIQFFCHNLVKLLRQKGLVGEAPYMVRQDHVDEVAMSREIRDGIWGRFDETFRLDARYRAISLSMMYHYHGPDTASQQSLTIGEVREHVIDLVNAEVLASQFMEHNLSDLDLESLLNELVGLGILVQHGTGYRIRSQRMARVFGTEEAVFDEMIKLNESR